MSDKTVIDLRTQKSFTWKKSTGSRHTFELVQCIAWLIEVEKQRFHTESAVFMPDFIKAESKTKEEASNEENLAGLAILRTCYLHAIENPAQRLLLVGHTDTSGTETYNAELSQKRADNLLYLLVGDKDKWSTNSYDTHQTKDYQQILTWISRAWGLPCDPQGIDNQSGAKTKRAIRHFKQWYNNKFNQALSVNSEVNKQMWAAFFDVYLTELSLILATDTAGLKNYQAKLTFLNDNCKASGGGENYPIDILRVNNYRCAKNRRIEILFFDPEDEPPAPTKPTVNIIPAELDIIYKSPLFRFNAIVVEPVPQRVWVDLQTVNHFGLFEPNIALNLIINDKTTIAVTTNEQGYWSDRIAIGSSISIYLADGTAVALGTQKLADKGVQETAIIHAIDAGRAIRDIIVPTLSNEAIEQHTKLIKVYSNRNNHANKETVKDSATVVKREQPATLSSRGGEKDTTERLSLAETISDNLCIAAGWNRDLSFKYEDFLNILHQWLSDRFPSATSRGYFVQLLTSNGIAVIDPNNKNKYKTYSFASGKGIYNARIGAYSPFETQANQGDEYVAFVDMATQSSGFSSGDLAKIKNPQKNNGSEKDDNGYAKTLVELFDGKAAVDFKALIDGYTSDNRIDIAYFMLPERLLTYYAKEGGTGLLENYVENSAIRKRIHQRNCKVAKWVGNAYEGYLNDYIDKVNDINPKWQDFKVEGSVIFPKGEHPELRLYKLGPPDSSFRFPRAAGASTEEYREICALTGRPTIRCWEAVTKKLNAIRGEKGDGSIWFEVEFGIEAGELAGPLSGASLKLNFEVNHDDGLQIIPKTETEIPLTVKAAPDSAGTPANVKYSIKYDEKTEREIHTVEFTIGKYGIEADNTGTVKLKVGVFDQSMNQRTAVFSAGASVSLRDLVAKSFINKPPEWVSKLPDIKASAKVSIKLLSQGTLMRVISKGPGFFEMRPRIEFASLLWHFLNSDEHIYLEQLGWDQEKWDFGIRPASAKQDLATLTPDEKFAATRLPVPIWDPYWLEFWVAFANKRNS